MRKDSLARFSLCLMFVAYGLTVAQMSPLVSEIISDFGITGTQAGLINSMANTGGMIGIILLLFLSVRFRKGWIFIIASALFVTVMFLLGAATTYFQLLALMLAMGLGRMGIDSMANAIMSDRYREGLARHMNKLHMSFSIGGFSAPIIIGLLKQQIDMDWRMTYVLFAFIALAAFAMYIVFWRDTGVSGRQQQIEMHAMPARQSLLRDASFWIICLITFLYAIYQIGVTFWASSYFETTDVPAIIASFSASALWIGVIVSRMLAVRFGKAENAVKWTAFGSLAGGLVMLFAVMLDQPFFMLAAFFVSGVATGAVIPLLITKINTGYPAYTGTSSTVINLSITAGSIVAPLVMGMIADSFSLHYAMLVGGMPLLVIFVIAGIKFRGEVYARKDPDPSRKDFDNE